MPQNATHAHTDRSVVTKGAVPGPAHRPLLQHHSMVRMCVPASTGQDSGVAQWPGAKQHVCHARHARKHVPSIEQ
jgi:hypothetical protein